MQKPLGPVAVFSLTFLARWFSFSEIIVFSKLEKYSESADLRQGGSVPPCGIKKFLGPDGDAARSRN